MAPKRKASTFEKGDASRKGKEKEKSSRPERTTEEIYGERLESTTRRPILIKRDVSFEELGETVIFDEIRQRKWEAYVSFPKRANRPIVQEFYASIDPDEFERGAPVMVRRKSISMTAEQVNEYLHTQSYPQWEEGYESNTLFEHYDRQFGIALTGNEDIPWDDKVYQRDLGFEEHF